MNHNQHPPQGPGGGRGPWNHAPHGPPPPPGHGPPPPPRPGFPPPGGHGFMHVPPFFHPPPRGPFPFAGDGHPPPPPHHHGPPPHGHGGWGPPGHHPPPPHFQGPPGGPRGGPMGGMMGGMMGGARGPRGPRPPRPNIDAPIADRSSYPAKAFASGLDGGASVPPIKGVDGQGREAELRAKLELRQDDSTLYVLSNGVPTYQPRTEGGTLLTGSWTAVGANRRSGREDRNPNAVSAQEHVLYLPRVPHKDPQGYYHDIYNSTGCLWTPMGPVGVACNGVPLFNQWAFPDGATDAMDMEAFDTCCGHPAPGNVYHYHQYPRCVRGNRALGHDVSSDDAPSLRSPSGEKGGPPEAMPLAVQVGSGDTGGAGPVEVATATVVQGQGKEAGSEEVGEDKVADSLLALLTQPKGHSPIIGYAFDGFPIYGPVGWDAEGRPALMTSSYDPTTKQYVQGRGVLDECNGVEGPTPEYPLGLYHYHCTIDPQALPQGRIEPVFPYLLAKYRGVPEQRNLHGPPGGMGPPPPR